MADSSNRALFFWKKDTLARGDRNIIGAYLFDLSKRLRDNPTPEECGAAAEVCERIAQKGASAWKACGFIAAHRPRKQFQIEVEIWNDVRTLVASRNMSRTSARARVAKRYRLSVYRVKAIDIELERKWRKECSSQMA